MQNELCNHFVEGHPSSFKFVIDLLCHVLHNLLGTMFKVSVEKIFRKIDIYNNLYDYSISLWLLLWLLIFMYFHCCMDFMIILLFLCNYSILTFLTVSNKISFWMHNFFTPLWVVIHYKNFFSVINKQGEMCDIIGSSYGKMYLHLTGLAVKVGSSNQYFACCSHLV